MFTKTILVMVVLIMTTMLPKHVQRKLKKNKSFMTCWVSCEPLVYRQMSKRKLLAFQRQANAAKLQWPNLTKAGLFLKVLQISQENTCARVSFLIKKIFWHRCFPVNFATFFRTHFLQNNSEWLLVTFLSSTHYFNMLN